MNDTESRVRAFVTEAFPTAQAADPIDAEASFFDTGIIDSIGVLTLVTWIEEEFGVVVDDDEVVPENIDGVARLVRYVEAKRAAAGLT